MVKRYFVVIRHIERGHTEEIDVRAPNEARAREKAEVELKTQHQNPDEREVLEAMFVSY